MLSNVYPMYLDLDSWIWVDLISLYSSDFSSYCTNRLVCGGISHQLTTIILNTGAMGTGRSLGPQPDRYNGALCFSDTIILKLLYEKNYLWTTYLQAQALKPAVNLKNS